MATNQFQLNVISNWDRAASVIITKVKANLSWTYSINPLQVENYGGSTNPAFDADESSYWQVTVTDSTGTWATKPFPLSFPASAAGSLYSFVVFRQPNSVVGILGSATAGFADLQKSQA